MTPSDGPQWQAYSTQFGSLQSILLAPSNKVVTQLCVMMHGYGAPGDDLVSIGEWVIQALGDSQQTPAFLFPEAPIDLTRYGIPGGRAWWPLNMAKLMELSMKGSFDEMREEAPPGIDEARQMLLETIQAAQIELQAGHLPLFLGGFSQGAMLAVDTALRGLERPPEKLFVLSGATVCESLWEAQIHKLSKTDIVQSHGDQDMILPAVTGQWLGELLRKSGTGHYQMLRFEGGHGIPIEVYEALLKRFLDYDS